MRIFVTIALLFNAAEIAGKSLLPTSPDALRDRTNHRYLVTLVFAPILTSQINLYLYRSIKIFCISYS